MLTKYKKHLRTHQTKPEAIILWHYLRNRRQNGHKFRRQHILQNYIVDFVCLEKNLVIELDGSQHATQEFYDAKRSEILAANGYKILRFWNHDIFHNLEATLETILSAL